MSTHPHHSRPSLAASRRIRIVLVAAMVALLAGALAACGSTGDEGQASAGPAGAPGKGKSLVVVSAQKAGDKGPIDDVVNGMKRAQAQLGVKARFIEVTDPSNFEATLRNLGQLKTSIVVAIFPDWAKSIKEVAPKYPDTKFIFLYADPYTPTIPNVRTVAYGTNQASYLAGVLAAKVTDSKKVGFITGLAIPNLNADFHAFEEGVRSVDAGLDIKAAAAGSWEDPAKGRLVAAAMLGKGIDTILSLAGGTSLGVIQAAADRNGHVIYDTTPPPAGTPGANSVIGTAVFRYGKSLFNNVQAALQSGWHGGHAVEGVKEDVAGLDLSQPFLQSGQADAVSRVKAAERALTESREEIASGKLVIKHDTSPF